MITCSSWVKRGVAKAVPDKVALSKEELQDIIDEAKEKLREKEEAELKAEDEIKQEGKSNKKAKEKDSDTSAMANKVDNGDDDDDDDDDDDIADLYELGHYDSDDNLEGELMSGAGMAGVTYYASNKDDPYITLKNMDARNEDEEDFNIKPDDNLIVAGHVDQDFSTLEISVYNEEEGSQYVHHDILLEAFPLAIEWLDFDPEDTARPGNFVALGTMEPFIDIWDVDVVDTLEPVVSLGRRKKKKSRKKSKNSEEGHSDAVLDLSWNRLVRNVLASASADHSVILWDLAQPKPVHFLRHHKDKVQSLHWHPYESQSILTGSFDKKVKVVDCRSPESNIKSWKFDSEVERVLWNHFSPFNFLASTENGHVFCCDVRTDAPVYTLKAHDDAIPGLALSSQVPGCLVTASADETVKVWDIQENKPSLVVSKNVQVGRILNASCCPDSPFVFCFGGEKQGLRVLDITESAPVRRHFGSRQRLVQTATDKVSTDNTVPREAVQESIHESFLRTVAPYSDQANVWVGLLKYFRWNTVILLTSNDQDSRMIASRFTGLAEKNSLKIEKTIMFQAGCLNVTPELLKLRKIQSRVILFSASEEDAVVVYRNASHLGMTGKGYVWLVTQQTFSGVARDNLPQGVIGMQLFHGYDESAQVQDAVNLVAKALGTLVTAGKSLTPPPTSCGETTKWDSGQTLFNELVNTSFENGQTGTIQLNRKGDRINSVYQIVNLRKRGDSQLKVVGQYRDGEVSISDTISWPGGQGVQPDGIFVTTHLSVVTLVGEPFVFITSMPKSGKCEDLDDSNAKRKHIRCTGKVYGEHAKQVAADENDHCCYGFCMDLLNRLAEKVNFTFDVHLSEDGSYGSLRRVNGTDMKRWNGMVGEVIDGKSDLIAAALTINNERAEWIEFSKPFKYQGLTILVKKDQTRNRLDSFLRPFQINLWLLVLLSVHIVAVILYLLDRFSPFGRFKLARKEKEETALNLSSAMWFSWGVLLNSGIGEGTPRSFSARVLGMVWAGFAMIIVASYTANLAAFLVLDRPKDVVSGIDDPNLRNPSEDFKYATVANSSVDAYFRRQVELSSMYTFMEKYNVKTAREAIQQVKNEELKAFIWDSPVLYYEASQDCELTTAGDLFGRSGYGIGMPKGSPWSNKISLAILNFHESGVMEELETTWIDSKKCAEQSNSPATLGLNHMLGVFIMVAAGIGAGVVIIILEILYHKHRGWKEEQKELAKKTTDKWRANIMMMKKERTTNGQQPNGVLDSHSPQTDGIARRNPIYNPENHVDSTFTYN